MDTEITDVEIDSAGLSRYLRGRCFLQLWCCFDMVVFLLLLPVMYPHLPASGDFLVVCAVCALWLGAAFVGGLAIAAIVYGCIRGDLAKQAAEMKICIEGGTLRMREGHSGKDRVIALHAFSEFTVDQTYLMKRAGISQLCLFFHGAPCSRSVKLAGLRKPEAVREMILKVVRQSVSPAS